jgi:hypothetical protein
MGSADYVFRTVWRVAGTADEVAAILGDATMFPRTVTLTGRVATTNGRCLPADRQATLA